MQHVGAQVVQVGTGSAHELQPPELPPLAKMLKPMGLITDREGALPCAAANSGIVPTIPRAIKSDFILVPLRKFQAASAARMANGHPRKRSIRLANLLRLLQQIEREQLAWRELLRRPA